ncbi:hypothetical protein F511_27958 [Dorcoceras hygrometricum]|uniref:Uncharacterized protein n=1 Tax=Dorcoceras hygrometricum TaxID=472368 RepID=A0A2Z7AT43_9LAMI|nr:hypothetical protein F511_27958 [Dorcoceras hygrometricum]
MMRDQRSINEAAAAGRPRVKRRQELPVMLDQRGNYLPRERPAMRPPACVGRDKMHGPQHVAQPVRKQPAIVALLPQRVRPVMLDQRRNELRRERPVMRPPACIGRDKMRGPRDETRAHVRMVSSAAVSGGGRQAVEQLLF